MKRQLALALVWLLSVAPTSVWGLGLGEIKLHSALNQTLDAEVELLSPSPAEIEGLVVRLATPELFERYGIERTPLVTDLRFEVVVRSDHSAFVRITSTQPVREPFLTLLVEAKWPRGRLLREYTMLVDPPAFVPAEPPAAAPAPAPAETPSSPAEAPTLPVPAAPAAEVPAAAAPTEIPAVQPEYTAPEAVAPTVESVVPPAAAPTEGAPATPAAPTPAPAAPEAAETPSYGGGDYGPVKRGDTLWGIASRLSADQTITINQMMIAIYRANPEAFRANINRLKAGAILRLPDLEAVRSISAREAFLEAKRQHEEWRPSLATTPSAEPAPAPIEPATPPVAAEPAPTPSFQPEPAPSTPAPTPTPEPEPRLTIQVPSEEPEAPAADPGARVAQLERELDAARAAGTNTKAKRDRIMRLTKELEEAKRLVELPSQTLADIQDQARQPEPETPAAVPSQEPPAAQPTTPTEAQPAEPAPTPAAAPPKRRAEKGIVDTILDNLTNPIVLGVLVALVLGIVGFLGYRRVQPKLAALAAARRAKQAATPAPVADFDQWQESTEDDKTVAAFAEAAAGADAEAPTVSRAGSFSGGMVGRTGETMVEGLPAEAETGSEKTVLMTRAETPAMEKTVMQTVAAPAAAAAQPKAAPAGHEDTVIGGTPIKLDENDPLSEADFHMAYGLYDQAADLLKKAAARDPRRRDVKLKLLEVYFASGNKTGFVEAARALRSEMGPKPDADWNSVLIFGKQLAPEEALFSEQATAGATDLDFAAAGGGTETAIDLAFDAPADAGSAKPAEESLDFDVTGTGLQPEPPVAPSKPAPAAAGGDLEFELGDFKLDTEATTQAPAATPAKKAAAPTLGDTDQVDTQSDFDKALQELSAFVDTNLPAEDKAKAGDDAGEFNLEGLDLGDDAGLGDVALEGGDAGNEIDTKLDLARAYIDMGDPDGAKNILDEVVQDGNEQQQAEAKKLLAQIK